jgi:hypothetical protein
MVRSIFNIACMAICLVALDEKRNVQTPGQTQVVIALCGTERRMDEKESPRTFRGSEECYYQS